MMAADPKFYNALVLTGPWGSLPAKVTSLSLGTAPAYNMMEVVVHGAVLAASPMRGAAVTLQVVADGVQGTLFVGRVASVSPAESGDRNAVVVRIRGEEYLADRDVCLSPRNGVSFAVGVFNEDGIPNCDADTAAFSRAPDARWWTAALAIEWIRDNMMLRLSAFEITDTQLAATFLDQEIGVYDCRGKPVLEALADILRQVGARMAFHYGSGACECVIFDESGQGTFQVHYRPTKAQDAEVFEIATSVSDARRTPVVYAVSGGYLYETSYSSDGTDPLLGVRASTDKQFAWEVYVQVENYSSHMPIGSLAAGSRPYRIRPQLLTRRSPAGYLTAAQMIAAPASGEPIDLRETISVDTGGGYVFVSGGVRMYPDCDGGVVLRLKDTLTRYGWSIPVVLDTAPEVRFSCVTELPGSRSIRDDSQADDFDEDADLIVNAEQLRPGKRYSSWVMSNLSDAPQKLSAAEETVVDVDAELRALLASAVVRRAKAATGATVKLPFVSREIPIGAKLQIVNAPSYYGLTGNEIITEVDWDAEDMTPVVHAVTGADFAEERQESARRMRALRAARSAAL